MIRKASIVLTATLLASLMLRVLVFASSLSIRLAGNTVFSGNETSVSLQITGSAGVGGDCVGVCGITANLTYDTSKLELVSAAPSQGFDYLAGSTAVLSKATGASDGTILTYTFRNIGLASGESTTVSFANIVATNASAEFSVPSTSISLTYQAPAPQPQPQSTPTTPSAPIVEERPTEAEHTEEKPEEPTNPTESTDGSSTEVEETNTTEEPEEKKPVDWSAVAIWILSSFLALSLALNIYLLFFCKKRKISRR